MNEINRSQIVKLSRAMDEFLALANNKEILLSIGEIALINSCLSGMAQTAGTIRAIKENAENTSRNSRINW